MSGNHPSGASIRERQRELRRTLDSVDDARIAQVVALVDGLSERGEADGLIAPLRARLAVLRPLRVLGFARVLFTPLDPVIQPAPLWRRGALGIPRTAIAPLAAQVRAALGAEAEELEALLRTGRADPARTILLAGSQLWPRAAVILRALAMPGDWPTITGLGQADHASIAGMCATVLEHAPETETMLANLAGGLAFNAGDFKHMLASAAAHGPMQAGLLLAVLLARIAAVQDVLLAAGELARTQANPDAAAALDQAIEFQLNKMEAAREPNRDLAIAAQEAHQIAALADALDQPGQSFSPARATRSEALRRKADAAHRAHFGLELEQKLMQSAKELTRDATDGQVTALETQARSLRRYAGAARRLGGGAHYDRLLQTAASQVGTLALPLVDRVRLVELMLGTDAAAAVLERG